MEIANQLVKLILPYFGLGEQLHNDLPQCPFQHMTSTMCDEVHFCKKAEGVPKPHLDMQLCALGNI
jgi:hypothetical protein